MCASETVTLPPQTRSSAAKFVKRGFVRTRYFDTHLSARAARASKQLAIALVARAACPEPHCLVRDLTLES